MDNEKVLARLDIKSKWTKLGIACAIIWYVAGIVMFWLGSYFAPKSTYSHKGFVTAKYAWFIRYADVDSFEVEGEVYPEYYFSDRMQIEIIEDGYEGIEPIWEIDSGLLTIVIAISLIVVILPILLKLPSKFIAKRCQLELTENQIKGQLKMPFSTKKLQMPIDKLDNVFTSNSIADKFRSGETVIIHSNSGVVKFHYVHNAEEFAQLAMKRIEEARKENTVQVVAPPVQNTAPASSLTEKIAELQSLKVQGILTEEQFEAKKQDLISKF